MKNEPEALGRGKGGWQCPSETGSSREQQTGDTERVLSSRHQYRADVRQAGARMALGFEDRLGLEVKIEEPPEHEQSLKPPQ